MQPINYTHLKRYLVNGYKSLYKTNLFLKYINFIGFIGKLDGKWKEQGIGFKFDKEIDYSYTKL